MAGAQAGDDAVVPLRILATTDLHANLLAWDYHTNRVAHNRGLARVASLIAAARAERPQALLFDNGDFLHGTALGDHIAETRPEGRGGRSSFVHPMIAAMNLLRYDAVTLGNHEFSYGIGFLRRSLAAADFPVICSNLYFKPSRGQPLAVTSQILPRSLRDRRGRLHDINIGVIGFLPPQTMVWERRYLRGRAAVDDIVASARHIVPDLRRAGADLIVALSHSGLGDPSGPPGAENASSALANLDGIDVVIAGHTHLAYPDGRVRGQGGKPAVSPGFFGSHLGVIDLGLRKSRKGWQIATQTCGLRPIASREGATGQMRPLVADAPAVVALALPLHNRLLQRGDAVIGKTPLALNSYFAMLCHGPALHLLAQSEKRRITQVLQDGPYGDLPVLCAVSPFKAGGRGGPENYTDIPAGPLLQRHLTDLYPYPNSLTALRVTGAELALWLERSVSQFHQITPTSRDVPLLDAAFPSFNFDTIVGLTYQIDLTQPARFDVLGREVAHSRRITDLRHLGEPVAADQVFALASNSYRSAGGAGFAGALPARMIYDGDETNREVLEAYLRDGFVPEPVVPPPWTFRPIPGATVLFDSAPEAAAHLAEVPHLRLAPLDLCPDGFRRFRLTLYSAICAAMGLILQAWGFGHV